MVVVRGSRMQETEFRRISDVLGQRSFRNGLGYAIFCLMVMLPTVDSWQSGTEVEQNAYRDPWHTRHGVDPMRGWPKGRPSVREQMNRSWWPDTSRIMWMFGKTILAVFGATVSLLILMPFRGCKRYAVLFGPPMGLMVVSAVGLWLMGRTEIYRFEPVVIATIAASPTFALWYFCCKSAYESRRMTSPIGQAEALDERRARP